METQRFFHHENYLALVAAIGRKVKDGDSLAAEDADSVSSHFKRFLSYVDGVYCSELGIHLASASMEGQELRDRITELDGMRSRCHDAAIAGASIINRIAAAYGVGPIFTGDPNVRRQVAAFCIEVVDTLFENRR